ncbi:cytochrome P450 monooxygenase CYP4H10, partial [Asbolus verrucosus]
MIPLIVLLILTPFLWWYLTLRKHKSLEKIPGPKPKPFIGNSLDLGSSPQASELKVVISKPELIEMILSSNVHITKSHAYDLLIPWLGIGLLISTEVFNSAGNILIEKLSKEVGKESTDIFSYINLYSLDVICGKFKIMQLKTYSWLLFLETSMGYKIDAQKNKNTDYVAAVRGYLDIFMVRMFSAWERFGLLFQLFSKKYPVYKHSLNIMHKFTNGVIIQRREEKSRVQLGLPATEDGIKRKVALLDMLLESESNNVLTNEDIREEIDTFMFEGHDTTTSGISFTILALADNPDVQGKVYQEIRSIMGTDEIITMKHLNDMKYLEMVIKEAQRFYTTVPLIERKLETDCNIGITLTLFLYGLHHSEDYFSDPQKFDPDRFLPENQSTRHKFAYVPFSAGPRNCIVPNYKPDLGVAAILKSYNGIQIQLQSRQEKTN